MTTCLLTIVTVTLNNRDGLLATARSLPRLLENDSIQWVVKDGGSRDGSQEALTGIGARFDWVGHPDGGIYDAMNQGLAVAKGDYVWFLNGGDECTIETISAPLLQLMTTSAPGMIFCDYALRSGDSLRARRARSAWYLVHALPTSHQAILYRRNPGVDVSYDTSFTICGDYDLTARLWRADRRVGVLHEAIAIFDTSGVSSSADAIMDAEIARVQRTVIRMPRAARGVSTAIHRASRRRRLRWRRAVGGTES